MAFAIGTVALGNQSGTVTLDGSRGNRFTLTATGNLTLGFTNVQPGLNYTVVVTQDASGSRSVSWDSTVVAQGDFVPAGNETANGKGIFEFTGATYSSVELTGYSTYTGAANAITSKNDTDVYIIPGYNTTAHTGGASGGVRRGVNFFTGYLGNTGGYNGKGAFQTWTHPTGILEDKQIFGTAGSPDTNLYVRWAYPQIVRWQLTGNSSTYALWELTNGAAVYHDSTLSTSFERWRDGSGNAIFDISGGGGVSFGVASVANMARGVTQYLGVAAPSASPAAGNEIRWLDTTTLRESRKNSAGTYNTPYIAGTSVLSASTGAVAIDASKSNTHNVTATGNLTITITNGVPGDTITLVFTQDGTGGRTLTLGAGLSQATGVTITPGVAAGAVSVYTFKVLTATTAILTSASRA